MIGVLVAIAMVCLFPVWPLGFKVALLYISVSLLYLLLGIILVRLVIYFFFRIFGLECWLFPNLFMEVAFIDSFIPIVAYEKADDGKLGWILRTLGLIFVAMTIYKLVQEPAGVIDYYSNLGPNMYNDIIDWGKNKLDPNTTTIDIVGRKGIRNFEEILKDTHVHEDAEERVETYTAENDDGLSDTDTEDSENKKRFGDEDEED